MAVDTWHELHQKLGRQGGWALLPPRDELPIVPGTLIRIHVEHLPGNRTPEDVWLWHTAPADTAFDLDLLWKTYLRRFDLEHTFKTLKTATLGAALPVDGIRRRVRKLYAGQGLRIDVSVGVSALG
jgi:hypothetical protein